MDFDGLTRVLTRIHAGEIRCIARDTTEPSPLCYEILNARPYAFLDDAPLEERRTQAVQMRRASSSDDFGTLDANAIERVRDEERPDPRDADELHDALLTFGFLTDEEVNGEFFGELVRSKRAGKLVIPSREDGSESPASEERLRELAGDSAPSARRGMTGLWVAAPPSRIREWTRDEAVVEIIRGRLSLLGPTTANALANSLNIEEREAEFALLKLESEGVVLRGTFEERGRAEWCDRRLLARIHRYTLNRLRAEIEPVGVTDFMRFLFSWQHVAPFAKLTGVDGLRAVVAQLDGYEVAGNAWERAILPSRIEKYDATWRHASVMSVRSASSNVDGLPSVS